MRNNPEYMGKAAEKINTNQEKTTFWVTCM